MANRIGTEAKVGLFAKVVRATAWRKASYSWNSINSRNDSSSKDNRNIMDINSSKTASDDSRKVGNSTVEKTATTLGAHD